MHVHKCIKNRDKTENATEPACTGVEKGNRGGWVEEGWREMGRRRWGAAGRQRCREFGGKERQGSGRHKVIWLGWWQRKFPAHPRTKRQREEKAITNAKFLPLPFAAPGKKERIREDQSPRSWFFSFFFPLPPSFPKCAHNVKKFLGGRK